MELEYALLIGIFTAVFSFPFYQMIVMCCNPDAQRLKREKEQEGRDKNEGDRMKIVAEGAHTKRMLAKHTAKQTTVTDETFVVHLKKMKAPPKKPRRHDDDDYGSRLQRVHNDTVERVEMMEDHQNVIDEEMEQRRAEAKLKRQGAVAVAQKATNKKKSRKKMTQQVTPTDI
jgi:hypothetical protein